MVSFSSLLFFFNDTATTEIYTLSLHDALPICGHETARVHGRHCRVAARPVDGAARKRVADRKSTRLNSSHLVISYAVFCLKKKKNNREMRDIERPYHETLHVVPVHASYDLLAT